MKESPSALGRGPRLLEGVGGLEKIPLFGLMEVGMPSILTLTLLLPLPKLMEEEQEAPRGTEGMEEVEEEEVREVEGDLQSRQQGAQDRLPKETMEEEGPPPDVSRHVVKEMEEEGDLI